MSIDKTYLVAGGDMRQLYLAKTLAKQGNRVYIACFEEASELSPTGRGEGGFGSTGK